nr:MAG TPA: hypothetical protein [Bacteriophage sp.]
MLVAFVLEECSIIKIKALMLLPATPEPYRSGLA